MALLEIRDLKKYFPTPAGLMWRAQEHVKAIDGVSLDVEDGETVGLVGESGCGKTTLGRCIVRLIEPSSGTITFEGSELSSLPGPAMREMRRKMQIIFQDPYASLNPRMRVGEIIGEGLRIHGLATAAISRRGSRNCWRGSDCAASISVDILMNSRADSASASVSPGRSP